MIRELETQANKGNPEAQLRLGRKMQAGHKGIGSKVQAYAWLSLACLHPKTQSKARKSRDALGKNMPAEHVVHGLELAKSWYHDITTATKQTPDETDRRREHNTDTHESHGDVLKQINDVACMNGTEHQSAELAPV